MYVSFKTRSGFAPATFFYHSSSLSFLNFHFYFCELYLGIRKFVYVPKWTFVFPSSLARLARRASRWTSDRSASFFRQSRSSPCRHSLARNPLSLADHNRKSLIFLLRFLHQSLEHQIHKLEPRTRFPSSSSAILYTRIKKRQKT